jgi:hypothetical protein
VTPCPHKLQRKSDLCPVSRPVCEERRCGPVCPVKVHTKRSRAPVKVHTKRSRMRPSTLRRLVDELRSPSRPVAVFDPRDASPRKRRTKVWPLCSGPDTLGPMSGSSVLSLSVLERLAGILGRPKLRLSYDNTDKNCRDKVIDVLESPVPFLDGAPGTRVPPHAPPPYQLHARAFYLRVVLDNIGKSKAAEGSRVFVTSVSCGGHRVATAVSPLQWAHVPPSQLNERYNPRTIFVGVPQTLDLCKASVYDGHLSLLTEYAERGGHTFAEKGLYDIMLRAVGTNWVSPAWMTIRVHFDPDDIAQLHAEVVSARSEYRLA